jgi:hypothetical protein
MLELVLGRFSQKVLLPSLALPLPLNILPQLFFLTRRFFLIYSIVYSKYRVGVHCIRFQVNDPRSTLLAPNLPFGRHAPHQDGERTIMQGFLRLRRKFTFDFVRRRCATNNPAKLYIDNHDMGNNAMILILAFDYLATLFASRKCAKISGQTATTLSPAAAAAQGGGGGGGAAVAKSCHCCV